MFTCPWCGTNYAVFQPNCTNCGGALPAVNETYSDEPPMPPLAPRSISQSYARRLLFSDGWAIAAFVFGLLGVIFSFVGGGLTLGIITAFIGLPFLLLGVAFLGAGGGILIWRYQNAQKIVYVLRDGEATRGEIVDAQPNYHVRVNGRNPWVIRYRFQANGQSYDGNVSTLNQVGQQFQAGKAVCILYLPSAPQWNSIYPHP